MFSGIYIYKNPCRPRRPPNQVAPCHGITGILVNPALHWTTFCERCKHSVVARNDRSRWRRVWGTEGRHMPPGANRRRRQREWSKFLATRNTQKFCEFCLGRDGHGRTNHVHRTMHILDVISSVCPQNAPKSLAAGALP